MKRFLNVLPLALAAILAVSCYDDSKVMERLDNLESRVDSLTTQVGAVETLIKALESNVYIKAVTEVTGGYEIEFTDGKKITIKDGENGADAPEIGALKDADGIYYWTLDGEWLLDAEGNKVPAGMGQPKLKTEDGQWYISADGQEWSLIGPNVACTIKSVEVADDAVTFTLADGTKIVIPVFKTLDITFNIPEEGKYYAETATFEYTIAGGTENNRVAVMCAKAEAVVTVKDANSGVITVGPLVGADVEIVVWVTDGVSKTIFKTLKYSQGLLTTEEELVTVAYTEGTLTVPVATVLEYVASVESGCDWITVPEETKSVEIRNEEVVFNVAENMSLTARTAKVYITPKDPKFAAAQIVVPVVQEGRAKKAWSKEVKSYEGYDATKQVRLAKYGDNILLANTTKVYVLDPATGEAINTINMPEGVTAHSVLVDDAGNFMIAANAPYSYEGQETPGVDIVLYLIPDPLNPVPEAVLTYNTANYYGVETGNFRVKGNVKDDAVITATVADGGSGAAIMWEIVDGVFTEYQTSYTDPETGEEIKGSRNWSYAVGPYSAWAVSNVCCAPAGTSLADGLFYIGYGGDYNLRYVANVVEGANEWGVSYVTGSTWMENYGCIATATYGEGKYAAIVKACHFAYDATDMVLLDVTDPAAAKELYVYNGDGDAAWDWGAGVNNSWTGGGTFSDVLLAPTADGMLMVYVDSNYGTVGCVAIK